MFPALVAREKKKNRGESDDNVSHEDRLEITGY
jgi:hypothetical protein